MPLLFLIAVLALAAFLVVHRARNRSSATKVRVASERCKARYFDDSILLSDTDAWTYLRLATVSIDFRTTAQLDRLIADCATALAGLGDAELHLKCIRREEDLVPWLEELDRSTMNPAPGWPDFLQAQHHHLQERETLIKAVYLGVRLGHRSTAAAHGKIENFVRDVFAPLTRIFKDAEEIAAGHEDDVVAADEIAKWHAAAGKVHRLMARSRYAAVPATASELEWTFRHQMHPDMPLPPARVEGEAWGGGEIIHLVNGEIDNVTHPDCLVVRQRNHDFRGEMADWRRAEAAASSDEDRVLNLKPQQVYETYVATLSISRVPRAYDTDEHGGWITHADSPDLPGMLEFDGRYTLHPHRTAAKDVKKQVSRASDQKRHFREAGAEPTVEISDALEEAESLDVEIARNRKSIVKGAGYLIVSARTHEDLHERCEAAIEHYRDIGIDVEWTHDDQLALFMQQFPGDTHRVKVKNHRQIGGLEFLAGGLPQATNTLGDEQGPYYGLTTGQAAEVIRLDPLAAPAANLPGAIALVGQPGGGKTFATLALAYASAQRGITTVYIDPKGDAKGLAELTELGDVRLLELGTGQPGLLDPFTLSDNRQRGMLLAMDTLTMLLGGQEGMDKTDKTVMMRAVRYVARTAEKNPSLSKVMNLLLDGGAPKTNMPDAEGHATERVAAEQLGERLRTLSELDLGGLCFGEATAETKVKIATNKLTIVTLAGLSLPSAQKKFNEYGWSEILGVALMLLVTNFAREAMGLTDTSRRDRRFLIIDEAWAVTSVESGAKLVEEVARMGRSRNTAEALVSQNAGDLLDERVKNCITTTFVFHSEEDEEIEADLRLLRIKDVEENRVRIANLPTGSQSQFVMRDMYGRVGTGRCDMSYQPHVLPHFDTTPDEQVAQGATRTIAVDSAGQRIDADVSPDARAG